MNGEATLLTDGFSQEQREDFAALLGESLPRGNIEWLAGRVLGEKSAKEAIGDLTTAAEVATAVIERMELEDKLPVALQILKSEATGNGMLMRRLNHVLSGSRLSTFDVQQAVVQAQEDPFFDITFLQFLPRIQQTVCAIGIGNPENKLLGTGFLIGPDLVLTNYHVLDAYLDATEDGQAVMLEKGNPPTAVSGDNIYCFFDYMSGPRPIVPPLANAKQHHSLMVKAASQDWLVCGRTKLQDDGCHPYADAVRVGMKFDYAVIRLARRVGEEPSQSSGGMMRGWISLSDQVDYVGATGIRLVILQHPGGVHQLFDVGIYNRIDPSDTRIWYTVNTLPGSSGAPAVDKQGRLYAVHNATVLDESKKPKTVEDGQGQILKVNQGVRADQICKDLAARLGKMPEVPLANGDVVYWSLSDNVDDPQAIIGRKQFRQHVAKMIGPADSNAMGGERILAVTGAKGSGRHFSIRLLRRLIGADVPIVHLKPSDLQQMTPRRLVDVLVEELSLSKKVPIPEPKSTESTARWLGIDLPAWVAAALADAAARTPSRYPAWIVVDATKEQDERLIWQDGLKELVSALTGEHDVGQQPIDIPQLRWLFLGESLAAFPPTSTARLIDDLAAAENTQFAEDFADCLGLAWRSVRISAPQDRAMLVAFGADLVADPPAIRPLLATLAAKVRSIVAHGRKVQAAP